MKEIELKPCDSREGVYSYSSSGTNMVESYGLSQVIPKPSSSICVTFFFLNEGEIQKIGHSNSLNGL